MCFFNHLEQFAFFLFTLLDLCFRLICEHSWVNNKALRDDTVVWNLPAEEIFIIRLAIPGILVGGCSFDFHSLRLMFRATVNHVSEWISTLQD